ncbi:MAG: hypothetical protein FWG70_10095 [Oscillospiraceae bacterium]|nr:hypothetical protein [Oscillospiraceae bacterium]
MLRETEIKVIVSNQPTKQESEKKIKELCLILGNIWKQKKNKNKTLPRV